MPNYIPVIRNDQPKDRPITTITAAEVLAYFTKNSFVDGLGYSEQQIAAAWQALPDAERIEWEDEALADKIERTQAVG